MKNLIKKIKDKKERKLKILELEVSGVIASMKKYCTREDYVEDSKRSYLEGDIWPHNYFISCNKLTKELLEGYSPEILACAMYMVSNQNAEAGLFIGGAQPSGYLTDKKMSEGTNCAQSGTIEKIIKEKHLPFMSEKAEYENLTNQSNTVYKILMGYE